MSTEQLIPLAVFLGSVFFWLLVYLLRTRPHPHELHPHESTFTTACRIILSANADWVGVYPPGALLCCDVQRQPGDGAPTIVCEIAPRGHDYRLEHWPQHWMVCLHGRIYSTLN